MGIQHENTILLDKAGMLVSGLCAIHCSILPILLVLGVGTGFGWMLSHEVELIFLIVSLLIASYSLVQGYIKVHRRIGIVVLAFIGFFLLILGHEIEAFTLGIVLSTVGGISILLAHLASFRSRSRCIITK
ncbi:MAG: MerC domain-containing protein [Saprospiraceae bacterium]